MEGCESKDLVERKARWLVWGIPSAVIVIGCFAAPALRAWLWTPAFAAAGAFCVFNAVRCRRLHCYITGPLFLLAALASALEGAGVISIGWAWIGVTAILGTVFAHAVEQILGKYVRYPSPAQ